MKTVIAIQTNNTWIAVWNSDYDEAVQEAMADRTHREICYIENGMLLSFTSKAFDEPLESRPCNPSLPPCILQSHENSQ